SLLVPQPSFISTRVGVAQIAWAQDLANRPPGRAQVRHDPTHSWRGDPTPLDRDLVERLNGAAVRLCRRRDRDVEITATGCFHVADHPPRGRCGHHPVRVDALDSYPNVGDSPREAVVDVPLDAEPSGAVGLRELESKWCICRRSLRPGNIGTNDCR